MYKIIKPIGEVREFDFFVFLYSHKGSDFIISVFNRRHIMPQKLRSPKFAPFTLKKRGAVFDIQCEDASDTRFIKRSLFYLCMAVANFTHLKNYRFA